MIVEFNRLSSISMQLVQDALIPTTRKTAYLEVTAALENNLVDLEGHTLTRPHGAQLCEPPILGLRLEIARSSSRHPDTRSMTNAQ